MPTVGANPGFTAVQTYSYDQLNRIQDAKENINGSQTPEWKQTFKYDRYGNRNFDETNTTTLPKNCLEAGVPAVCAADRKLDNPAIDTVNNNNRFKEYQDADGIKDYEYDTAGNMKKDAFGKTFIYDGENKQVKVESGGSVIGEYWYDGDGKRVKKRGFYNNQWEETIFVYDASGRLVAEYSNQVAPIETAKVSYLTNDHLGSPRITTDKDGGVISRRDFMPFGEEISTTQREARTDYAGDDVRQKFTTYEREGESGLDFAQARYYGFSYGRFTSPDPYNIIFEKERGRNNREKYQIFNNYILQPQNWNRFVYVVNNPLNLIDPSGLIYVQTRDGKIHYIDDKDFNSKKFREEYGDFDVVPYGTSTIVKDGTGVFAPFEGKAVILAKGGPVEAPNIGTFQVESENAIDAAMLPYSSDPLPPNRDEFNTVYFQLELQVGPSGNPPRFNCFYTACGDPPNNLNPPNGCFMNSLADFTGDTVINGQCAPGVRGQWFRPGIIQWLPGTLGCWPVRDPNRGTYHTPYDFNPCAWPKSPF